MYCCARVRSPFRVRDISHFGHRIVALDCMGDASLFLPGSLLVVCRRRHCDQRDSFCNWPLPCVAVRRSARARFCRAILYLVFPVPTILRLCNSAHHPGGFRIDMGVHRWPGGRRSRRLASEAHGGTLLRLRVQSHRQHQRRLPGMRDEGFGYFRWFESVRTGKAGTRAGRAFSYSLKVSKSGQVFN